MYRIIVGDEFDSAHKLRGYKGKCKNLHGHTWRFQIYFLCEEVDRIGISVDFKDAKKWVRDIANVFDHKSLNNVFKKENPTAEVISRRIFLMAQKKARPFAQVEKVALWETPNNCIEYFEDGGLY
jgi:6-pyruvoyltetrahydropterin/6-carboxytetrahydropterin synthase